VSVPLVRKACGTKEVALDFGRGKIFLLTILTTFIMLATKRIPVTEAVWVELSDLKVAGQTYSQLLEEMIEDRKKARFFRDMEKIEEEGEFVVFPW
jgi:predicted CopG family antitoxin